ncbi:MAG: ribosome biogenesis GTPase YlqF [Bacillota bacterium]|nr:ribosome biogenesis GTPase YlqF [Bacillota bacterium]
MNIQWFPGHMAKTRNLIKENLKLIDVVLELVDARIPLSSKNPEILSLCSNKPILTLCNKSDLADPCVNKLWQEYFGNKAMFISSSSGQGINQISGKVKELLHDKIQRDAERGITGRSIKLMIVGVPNVGKSSFINKFSKKAATQVADRPGVTRGKQWIRLSEGFELLDTPGVLWPKFDDEEVAKRLAYTGAIKDVIIDIEELCHYLLEFLRDNYPDRIRERYKISDFETLKGYEITELIGRKRGFIVSGGEINTERAAAVILDEFRGGMLGRISLERP